MCGWACACVVRVSCVCVSACAGVCVLVRVRARARGRVLDTACVCVCMALSVHIRAGCERALLWDVRYVALPSHCCSKPLSRFAQIRSDRVKHVFAAGDPV
jgi:hypothetical protein